MQTIQVLHRLGIVTNTGKSSVGVLLRQRNKIVDEVLWWQSRAGPGLSCAPAADHEAHREFNSSLTEAKLGLAGVEPPVIVDCGLQNRPAGNGG
jgi:hypothetical protein